MIAILLACVMVSLITYWQIFKQGLFSALINAVLGIVAAMISFNYYEPLAEFLVGLGLAWLAPQTISMLALFILSFLIMREVFDRLVRGNMNFVLIIDRAGSAICGVIFGLTVTGMIAVAFQMLPISPTFLMFDRYAKDHDNYQNEAGLFPYPDNFITSLMSNSSAATFSGQNSFAATNTNLIRNLYLSRITLTPGSRNEAAPDAMTVQDIQFFDYDCPTLIAEEFTDRRDNIITKLSRSQQPIEIDINDTFIVVTVQIQAGAGDNPGARDNDGKIRTPMSNFRLVGLSPTDPTESVERYPIGVYFDQPLTHILKDEQGNILRTNNNREDQTRTVPYGLVSYKLEQGQVHPGTATMQLVFAWPTNPNDPDQLTPQPTFIQFRRSSTKPVPRLNASEQGNN